MTIDIRTYDAIGDEAFLMATWIKSYRHSGAVRAVPTPIYNIGQRNRIMSILRDPQTYILVACQPETPEYVYGYAVCSKPNIVHYVYVKNQFRRAGIGGALLSEFLGNEPVFYTHRSPEIDIERKLKEDEKLKNFIYNPFLLEKQ